MTKFFFKKTVLESEIRLKRCKISSRFGKHIMCQHFFFINRRARARAMSRNTYSGGRRAYPLLRAGASERVEIL